MKSIKFLEDNGVNIKRSLELFGDSVTYNETIGEFLVGIHDKINKLIKFMQNRDMANYAIMAHSMKSDANNFGFEKLANMALEHETHSKAGDMYYINEHINDWIKETNNAIILIQEYMSRRDKEKDKAEEVVPTSSDIYDKKTILVVDDSNIVRNFTKRIFEATYNVGIATNGQEALDIIEANKNNKDLFTKYCKRLGKRMFKEIYAQDHREPEYVNAPESKKD